MGIMSTPELIVKPSFPSDKLACRELWPRETEIVGLLADSRVIPELVSNAGFDSRRRVKIEIFNYGSINTVGQVKMVPLYEELPVVKGTYGLDVPLAVAVISRPDPEELPLTAETIADAQGLRLITNRLSRLAEAERIFQPTVNCYELLESHGLAIMLNQAVGAVRGENWGSAEVNLQIYCGPDEKIQPIFVFNPYTALNPDRFSDYWQMRRGYLSRKSFDPSTWERLRAISDSLASGYVAALAQVWFLTGRVPQKFGINSGDGVYDGSLFGPKGDFPQTAPVRLITIRGGFNSQPMNKLADFLCFLAGIKDNSMIFDLAKESKLMSRQHCSRANCFSKDVVFRGIDAAFRRMFGRKGREMTDGLLSGKTLMQLWRELQFNAWADGGAEVDQGEIFGLKGGNDGVDIVD